jgi:hypothetical protein
VLACELEGEAPLCPWPTVLASMSPAAAPGGDEGGANICREPVGRSCPIQSRMP